MDTLHFTLETNDIAFFVFNQHHPDRNPNHRVILSLYFKSMYYSSYFFMLQLIDDNPGSFVSLLTVAIGVSWLVYGAFWLIGRLTNKYKGNARGRAAELTTLNSQGTQASDLHLPPHR